MKTLKMSLFALAFTVPFLVSAQNWDDVYGSSSSGTNQTTQKRATQSNAKVAKNKVAVVTDDGNFQIKTVGNVNTNIDVDAYNRRYTSTDVGEQPNDTVDNYADSQYADDADDYQYTDRIVKYHNPQNSVTVSSDNDINVYVLDDNYNDYYASRDWNSNVNFGWGNAFYPWYSTRYGWYSSWYDPWSYSGWYGWGWPYYGGGWYVGYSPWYSGWGWGGGLAWTSPGWNHRYVYGGRYATGGRRDNGYVFGGTSAGRFSAANTRGNQQAYTRSFGGRDAQRVNSTRVGNSDYVYGRSSRDNSINSAQPNTRTRDASTVYSNGNNSYRSYGRSSASGNNSDSSTPTRSDRSTYSTPSTRSNNSYSTPSTRSSGNSYSTPSTRSSGNTYSAPSTRSSSSYSAPSSGGGRSFGGGSSGGGGGRSSGGGRR